MKNKLYLLFIMFSFVMFSLFISLAILLLKTNFDNVYKYSILGFQTLLILLNFGLVAAWANNIKNKREIIEESFDSYIEKSVSTAGVGLVIFNDSSDIIWTTKFIEERLNKKLVGKKLSSFADSFYQQFQEGKTLFNFDTLGVSFEARVDFESKTIVLKDITTERMTMKQYIAEKAVIGELEIDNFQQLQTILAEEDLFKLQSAVIKMLDDLVEKHNLTYRQYVNGKFLIYTNQWVLDEFIKSRFKFFDKIRSIKVIDGLNLSASLGISANASKVKDLIDMAKDGLVQALARGGDQVAVMELNKKPVYFGSKSESIKTSSRVKIKQIAKLLEEKLSSPSIKKVMVYGHVYADLDAVGSALGIAHLAKALGKNAYIQNDTFDTTTRNAINSSLSKEQRDVFIKKSKANKLTGKKDTLVVIVDTADLTRIENDKAIDDVIQENIFILDHHRVAKLPEHISSTNIYIDTSASSASEIVSEVLQFITQSIKPPRHISQMLLNGIYLDTKQFTKSTSSRTFAAASWLEKFGATSAISSDILKLPEEYATLVSRILSSVREIKPGHFISTFAGEVPHDIISLAADEILRVKNRKAAYVIAKVDGQKNFKLSARGIETNVQVIAEAVGGGGHFSASAAVSSEPLTVFEDNVIQSIVSNRGDD